MEKERRREREKGGDWGRNREHFGRFNVLILEFEKERREPLEPGSFNVSFEVRIFCCEYEL